MDIVQIPVIFGFGVLGLVILGLGYQVVSAWWLAREKSRR